MVDYTQQLKNICVKQVVDSNDKKEATTRFGIVPIRESDLWSMNTSNPGTQRMPF